jgi:serine/threonine protein phosphatase PrpC
LAASLAIDGVRSAGPSQNLAHTLQELNAEIRARGEDDVMAHGLATTLDVAILRKRLGRYRVEGMHVGDGTVLIQEDIEPMNLVQTHSVAGPALPTGVAGAQLLRAVGLEHSLEPDSWKRVAKRGQRYVLASDGLVNALGPNRLHSALVHLRSRQPRECVHMLLDVAVKAGAPDNVTVIVADVILTGED